VLVIVLVLVIGLLFFSLKVGKSSTITSTIEAQTKTDVARSMPDLATIWRSMSGVKFTVKTLAPAASPAD
jgi:hypothetical protein